MTNQLGDIIKEMRDPSTPEQRVDEIVRLLNEMGNREEKYKSWLQVANNQPRIIRPTLGNPKWVGSPLGLLVVQRIANVTVTTGTDTYITFDAVKQYGEDFAVSEDNTKIFWRSLQDAGFSLNGYVIWAGNATGYRALYVEGFDADDVSLGTAPLHTFAGQNLVDNVLPISFTFYFNGFDYVKFFVHQTSGGDLVMKEFTLGITLA